jgi:hypothetical protein
MQGREEWRRRPLQMSRGGSAEGGAASHRSDGSVQTTREISSRYVRMDTRSGQPLAPSAARSASPTEPHDRTAHGATALPHESEISLPNLSKRTSQASARAGRVGAGGRRGGRVGLAAVRSRAM